jgi:SAM-dependent methyltransferase
MNLQEITSNPATLKKLLEGSCVSDFTYKDWENGRKPISHFIDKPGTILDIGCANGFLLVCLQNWATHELNPFGIDPQEKFINEAKELFPNIFDHFIVTYIEDLAKLPKPFPTTFDYVYWAVWDDKEFDSQKNNELVHHALSKVSLGGKLILGFYDPQMEKNLKRIEQLKVLGYIVDEVVDAKEAQGEVFISIGK